MRHSLWLAMFVVCAITAPLSSEAKRGGSDRSPLTKLGKSAGSRNSVDRLLVVSDQAIPVTAGNARSNSDGIKIVEGVQLELSTALKSRAEKKRTKSKAKKSASSASQNASPLEPSLPRDPKTELLEEDPKPSETGDTKKTRLEKVEEAVVDAAENSKAKVSESASNAEKAVATKLSNAEDSVENGVQKVEESVSNAKESMSKAKASVEEDVTKVEDSVKNAAKRAEDSVKHARDTAKEDINKVETGVINAGKKAKEAVKEDAAKIEEKVDAAMQKAEAKAEAKMQAAQAKLSQDVGAVESRVGDMLKPYMPYIIIGGIILVVAFLLYVFRRYIKPCVHYTELFCEYLFRAIFLPFQLLRYLLRKLFYPVKQCCVSIYNCMNDFFYPASVRV